MLDEDKRLRIDNQYYLKNRQVSINYDELRDLILSIKDKINHITNEEIENIRQRISSLL